MAIDFNVPDLNKPNSMYKLNTNVMEGFKETASNGQMRLALEYMKLVVDKLVEEIEALKSTKTEAPAPAKKAAAAKAETVEE